MIVWFYEYVGFREVRIAQITFEELELPEVFVVLGTHAGDGERLRKFIVAVDHPIVLRIVELVIDRSIVELEPFVQYRLELSRERGTVIQTAGRCSVHKEAIWPGWTRHG